MEKDELLKKMNTKFELEKLLAEKIAQRDALQAEYDARKITKEDDKEIGEK